MGLNFERGITSSGMCVLPPIPSTLHTELSPTRAGNRKGQEFERTELKRHCRNIFLEQAFACCQLGGRCCVWRRPYPGFVIASIRSFLMPLIRCIDHICYLLSELRLYLHYVITLENELCYKVQNML